MGRDGIRRIPLKGKIKKINTEAAVTTEHKTQLDRDGYCVVRGLYSEEETQPVRARIEEMYEGRHVYGWPNLHLQTWDPDDRDTPGGNYRSGSLQQPAAIESVFADFARNRKLIAAMEALLGGPVSHYTDQTIFKPAVYKAGRSFYHQDCFYWRLRPRVCLNCWVALDAVDRGTMALGFLPGSHRRWRIQFHELYWDQVPKHGRDGDKYQRKRIPLSVVDDSAEEMIPGGPGDAVFFTNYTWHRGEPNLGEVNRAAYAIAYQLGLDDNLLSDTELDALADGAP